MSDNDICTAWHGVDCDHESDRVTKLSLSGNNLVGALPAAAGVLPALLQIDFSNNLLTSLPATMANMTQLRQVQLQGNPLNMPLPELFSTVFYGWTSLQTLVLSDNGFTGGLPDALCDLTAMQQLTIKNNPQLGGRVPAAASDRGKRSDGCNSHRSRHGRPSCGAHHCDSRQPARPAALA